MNRFREISNEFLVKTFRDDLAGETYHILKSNSNGGDAEFIIVKLGSFPTMTETLTETELLTKYQITF